MVTARSLIGRMALGLGMLLGASPPEPAAAWSGGAASGGALTEPDRASRWPWNSLADRVRNQAVVANVASFGMALEQYATDTRGDYPSPGHGLTRFMQGGYLPSNSLPANPWDTKSTSRLVDAKACQGRLISASAISRGARATAAGTVLGPGHRPGSSGAAWLEYGTLVYDLDRAGKRYVLYGIGRAGDDAIVLTHKRQ